jgi:hypothetical protein
MSAYKGQRGPNVSQYIANLNQLSPPQGPLEEPAPSEDDFGLFLNTDFYDVNNGPIPDFDAPIDLDEVAAEQPAIPSLGQNSRKHSLHTSADPNMEFNLNGRSLPSSFLSRACVLCFAVWPRRLYIACNPSSNRRGA